MLALRYAIKKWAALAALCAAFFYLLLSGAEVATQRSFIMTAIVLVGVMVDRSALTLRNLALAALAVLLFIPEAVVHPSFQMSFAATLALIAAYERGMPWMQAGAETSRGARVALWGGREIAALIVVSLAAGSRPCRTSAITFTASAPYGVIANLLAMPIVSVLVMPAGLLALLAMPFGFDAPLWRLMGLGIDWMIWVALFVAGLPGAVGRMAAFGTGPLLLCTAGLVLLCLLRSPLRWSGAAVIAAAAFWAVRAPVPDVYVGDRGDVVAVRGASGKLSVMRTAHGDTFPVREWLAADADARTPNDPSLKDGVTCDEIGCVARLADGAIVALPFAAEAFEEDCRRAALVVSQRTAPPSCAATADRPHGVAAHGRDGALSDRKRVGEGGGVSARLRPAVGARRRRHEARRRQQSPTSTPRRCDAAGRGSQRGRLRRLTLNTSGTGPPACPARARGWAAGCAPRRRCWRARARSRRRGGGSASASLPRRRSAPPRCRRCRRASPLRISTVSPSRMPASIIESPRTSSAK